MKKEIKEKCLILGIGNSGRQDDGLGWEILDLLKAEKIEHVCCEHRFQLQIEDAELLQSFRSVIFIDASKKQHKNGFEWEVCDSSNQYSFSTHALRPETILHLSETLYHHKPAAHILGISGFSWELKNGLSKKAKKNLEKAWYFLIHEVFKTHDQKEQKVLKVTL